ncbi:hypothetical protein ACFLQK_00605 [bacterium]
MAKTNADRYIRAAKVVAIILAAIGAAQVFLPGSGFNAPLSPGEAKTLLFADNYFTVTFLKSLYDNSMPLYYLVAHFIAFLPREIVMLRLFSFICFLGTLHTAFSLFRESAQNNKDNDNPPPALNTCLLFLGLAPLLIYYSWKAEPFSLAALLISLSCLHFMKAYVTRSGLSKPYITWTLLALYTTPAALFFFISHCLAYRGVKKHAGYSVAANDHAKASDLRKIFLCLLPAILILLSGFTKSTLPLAQSTPKDSLLLILDPVIVFF